MSDFKFKVTDNAGRVVKIQTAHKGKYLMAIPEINKGSAFTRERDTFGLVGKLPDEIESLDQQVARYYAQFQKLNQTG